MKKLIGLLLAGLFAVTTTDTQAQDYKKMEKKYYKHNGRVYGQPPHGNAYGYYGNGVFSDRPYYGYRRDWRENNRRVLMHRDGRYYYRDRDDRRWKRDRD